MKRFLYSLVVSISGQNISDPVVNYGISDVSLIYEVGSPNS